MMHPFTDVAIEYIIRFLSQTKMFFCRVSVFKIIMFQRIWSSVLWLPL